MNKKSSIKAFILNFLFPGIGFVYINANFIITITGILLFLVTILEPFSLYMFQKGNTSIVLFDIETYKINIVVWLIQRLLFGLFGYGLAVFSNNRSKNSQDEIFCWYCGTINKQNANFCLNCGKKLAIIDSKSIETYD
ncbi:hypothetical protein DRP43_02685 [candidate division TA06 bacterium]|uniref:Zinc-ribbon domain-containing protein n=1 Tax=candidate division TA06 bacterium TaxID=2250710 RepID=A0A660SMF2_UNCT6|nr:MAG: hypothetical protein DRP43_02685 [candidate division TA06 bacterium]